MTKGIKLSWLFTFFCVLIVGFFGIKTFNTLNSGELGEKEVLATLQSAEFEHRNDVEKMAPIFLKNFNKSKIDILGLPTNDAKFPRVWIALNKNKEGESLNLVPNNESFNVRCEYVESLGEHVVVDRSALELLKSRCTK